MEARLSRRAIGVGLSLWVCAALALAESPQVTSSTAKLSYAPYSKLSARRVEIMRLTRQGKFSEVEAFVLPIQAAYEKGETNEYAAYLAVQAFSTSDETLGPQLDRWVAQSPKSWLPRLARARWHRQAYTRFQDAGEKAADVQLAAALADYRAALAINPRLMTAYSDMVYIAGREGDEALASEVIPRALESDRTTWMVRDAMLKWGWVARDQVDAFLADAARYEQQNPMLLQLPAQVPMRHANRIWEKGQRAEALAIYDELLKTLDISELHKHRARLLRNLGRHAESRAAIDRAIALLPGNFDGYRERAWLHADKSEWPAMLADVRRGLEIDPLDPELNRGLGWALEELGDVPGAIEGYSVSVRWAPKASLFVQIGVLELAANDPKAARAACERALALEPKNKWAWYNLADALERLGDARAAKAWEHFVSLADPKAR
jgi:tetratricopeptide (TPR) repeat protein